MEHIFTAIVFFFDIFILLAFFHQVFERKKAGVSNPVLAACYLIMECSLLLNTKFCPFSGQAAFLFTLFISLFSTFLLTLLYEATFFIRLLVSFIFQLFACLGEFLFSILINGLYPDILSHANSLIAIYMELGSKVVTFFLCLIFCIFHRRISFTHPIRYHIMFLSTPLVSMLIMAASPFDLLVDLQHPSLQNYFYAVLICLILLNVVNFILISYSIKASEQEHELCYMKQQIEYQQNKYIQLGSAYKTNRKVLHDTKKHYFTIQQYLDQQDYDSLNSYLQYAQKDMEQCYVKINTGNLVIDSFVSNFLNVAKENQITFDYDIHVETGLIPLNDYELCIILGNLLDNCLNACVKSGCLLRKVTLEIYTHEHRVFSIHTTNSYQSDPDNRTAYEPNFDHGYGLQNIEAIVTKNHGIYKTDAKEYYEVTIAIPIQVQKKI